MPRARWGPALVRRAALGQTVMDGSFGSVRVRGAGDPPSASCVGSRPMTLPGHIWPSPERVATRRPPAQPPPVLQMSGQRAPDVAPGPADDPEELAEVRERPDVRRGARVDRADRDPGDPAAHPQTRRD